MLYVSGSLALLFALFSALMLFGVVATCMRLTFKQACALLLSLIAVALLLWHVSRPTEKSNATLAMLASVFVVEKHLLSAVERRLKLAGKCRRERAQVIGESVHPSRRALSLSHLRSIERSGYVPCVVKKLYHVTTERHAMFSGWYAQNVCKETAKNKAETVTTLRFVPISERERKQLETLRADYITALERSRIAETVALGKAERELDNVRASIRNATSLRVKRVTLTNKAGRKNRVRYYRMPERDALVTFTFKGTETMQRTDYDGARVVNVTAMFPRLLSADWKTQVTTLVPKTVNVTRQRRTFAETRAMLTTAIAENSKAVAGITEQSKAERTIIHGAYSKEANTLATPVHVSAIRNTFTLDKVNGWLRKYIQKMYAEHNGETRSFSSNVLTYDATGRAHLHNVNANVVRDDISTVQSPTLRRHFLRFTARDVEQETLLILWQRFLASGKLPTDEQCKAVARDMFNEMYRHDRRNIGLEVLANMVDPATL